MKCDYCLLDVGKDYLKLEFKNVHWIFKTKINQKVFCSLKCLTEWCPCSEANLFFRKPDEVRRK